MIGQSANRSGVTLKIRTAVWLDEAVQPKPAFSSLSTGTYFAKVGKVNFSQNLHETLSLINDWIRTSTEGRILQGHMAASF